MSEANKLDRLFEISLIDTFAERYSLHPDIVFNTDFDTLIILNDLWNERNNYFDRYREVETKLNVKEK
jgi:hypothetical protein